VLNDRDDAWLQPAFGELARVMKPHTYCVSFYGWSAIDRFSAAWLAAGLRPVGHLTFPKRYTSAVRHLRYQHENAYLLAKGSPRVPRAPIGDVLEWTYSGNRYHATEKPLSILMPIIEAFSAPDALILDPFAGSGSTCVAAAMLGRRFLGFELATEVHRIATARLAAMPQPADSVAPAAARLAA
jgi:site-specific DNA-methyltransferase (adenine-specific)